MKANELRIGNLVIANNPKYRPDKFGKICVISAIDCNRPKVQGSSGVSCTLHVINDEFEDTFGHSIEFIEPIPLTEEWYNKLQRPDDGAYTWVYSGNTLKVFHKGVLLRLLTTVHEYQNFYHALTGEELRYNINEVM